MVMRNKWQMFSMDRSVAYQGRWLLSPVSYNCNNNDVECIKCILHINAV